MAQSLCIPEVLSLVCEELDRESCLLVALTCRAFTEPALDKIWRDITSFEPLVCCLPEDLLQDESNPGVLTLKRYLTLEDLTRYLTIYAHRIRTFSLHLEHQGRYIAAEVFNSVQMVTGYQAGVLSPLLQHFQWPSPELDYCLFHDLPSWTRLSPYLSLFLGDTVRRMDLEWHDTCHSLYTGSVLYNTRRLTQVREIRLLSADPQYTVYRYLGALPTAGTSLDTVFLKGVWFSEKLFQNLAKLSSLRRLEIDDISSQLDVLRSTVDFEQASLTSREDPTSFASLRVIKIRTSSPFTTNDLLQFLPPGNKLEEFRLSIGHDSKPDDCREAIEAVLNHCNVNTLQCFKFTDCGYDPPSESLEKETIELSEKRAEDVAIWELCKFTSLTEVAVRCGGHISLNPQDVARIPASWPNLQHLDLCSMQYSYGRMPAVGHTHVLEIVQGCPSLRYLGVRFDSTQLTGEEKAPEKPSPLRTLRVGESPVHSPARVTKFIKANFPLLQELDVHYLAPASVQRPNMLDKRWAEVVKSCFDRLP